PPRPPPSSSPFPYVLLPPSRLPLSFTLFPYTTLFRSRDGLRRKDDERLAIARSDSGVLGSAAQRDRSRSGLGRLIFGREPGRGPDRKSTRLNSSHVAISYAVFCLKKKNNLNRRLQSAP